MKTKITVGIDNKPSEGLKKEWGLSLFIEYGGKKILLDTGGSDLFLSNYAKLGLNIGDVDYGVLSLLHEVDGYLPECYIRGAQMYTVCVIN